jgi:hypothetical protein
MQDTDSSVDPGDRQVARGVGRRPARAKSNRVIEVIGGVLVIVTGAYWYWSPLVAMHYARAAAEVRDADAFNKYVDYPKVRESLKGQFAARMAEGLTGSKGQRAPTAGAAFGAMLGIALVDKMIDSLVRPELVMAAMHEAEMREAQMDERTTKSNKAANTSRPAMTSQSKDAPLKVNWVVERKGMNRVIALASDATKPAGAATQIGFVFDRAASPSEDDRDPAAALALRGEKVAGHGVGEIRWRRGRFPLHRRLPSP